MCFLPFLILLSVTLNNGFILRLSCKTFADFSIIRKDTLLEEVFATFNGTSADQCKGRCILDTRCKSVNIKEDDLICKLNDKSAEDKKDNVTAIEKPGWTYYSTSYNDTLIGHNCRTYKPCPAGKRCMDTCICPGYNCSDINDCTENPCDNGGTCQSTPSGFLCNCSDGFAGATCKEQLIWIENYEMARIHSMDYAKKESPNHCYNECKLQGNVTASWRKSDSHCACSNSVDLHKNEDSQCIFISDGLKEWESNCSYVGSSETQNTPFNIHQKWQCYHVCKSLNVYNRANWLDTTVNKCKCINAGIKKPDRGTSCIKIESKS